LMCGIKDDSFLKCIGVLSLLGGAPDRMHHGCSIQSKMDGDDTNTKEAGTCIDYNKLSATVVVKFENVKRPVTMKKSKTRASCKIGLPDFLLSDDLLKIFELFLIPPEIQLKTPEPPKTEAKSKNEEEKKEDKSAEAANPFQVDNEWACPICTLHNVGFHNCDVCGSTCPLQRSKPKKKKKKKKEDPLWIPEEDEIPKIGDDVLAFLQLRSVALKTLCVSMQNHLNVKLILQHPEMLQNMVKIAIAPTDLEEYQSIEKLESISEKLLEQITDKTSEISSMLPALEKQKTHREIIKKSIYRIVPLPMPCKVDLESAGGGIEISRKNPNRVRFNGGKSWSIGYCKAKHKIPAQYIESYYFEVTIRNLPDCDGWGIAVGLWRDGFDFSGHPGDNRSFAFCSNGMVNETVQGDIMPKPGGADFQTGDVVGVLFEHKQCRVSFTVNGTVTGDGKCNTGKGNSYFPMVWFGVNGAEVEMNFGQEDFKFPYNSTLPDGFIDDLISRVEDHDIYSEAELARVQNATMLQEMMVGMMGGMGFPIEICTVALERNRDEMNLAAEWLLKNGWAELEKMQANVLKISARDAEREMEESAGLQNNNSDEELDDDDDDNLWLVQQTGPLANASGRNAGSSDGERWLDEDLEQTLPVGLTADEISDDAGRFGNGAEAANPAIPARQEPAELLNQYQRRKVTTEPVKAEDIRVGMQLTCSTIGPSIMGPVWDSHWNKLKGRTGIVISITASADKVNMIFTDSDLGSFLPVCLPILCVHKPRVKVADPLQHLNIWTKERKQEIEDFGKTALGMFSTVPVLGVNAVYALNEKSLGSLRVRRGVMNLLAHWPSDTHFDLENFGGLEAVKQLMLLLGAETLASGKAHENDSSSNEEHVLYKKLSILVEAAQEQQKLDELRLAPDIYKLADTDLEDRMSLMAGDCSDKDVSLNQVLVEEMFVHFLQAVRCKSEVKVFASEHSPYRANIEKKYMVHVPGANRLLVTFDQRTHLSDDVTTSLSFFSDSQYKEKIDSSFRAKVSPGTMVIIPANKFWVRFKTSNDNDYYGYRFKVKPLDRRMDDKNALQGKNLEFGCWLADLVLDKMPQSVLEKYVEEIFEVITFFTNNVSTSQKHRGIVPLIRLMHKIRSLGLINRINAEKLLPLKRTMEEKMATLDSTNLSMQSRLLQTVVELMAIMHTMSQDQMEDVKMKEMNEKIEPVDAGSLYVWKIRVVKSVWSSISNKSAHVDNTEEMSLLVRSYGETWARFPPCSEWKDHRFFPKAKDPKADAPMESKQLDITFEVYRDIFDPNVDGNIRREVMRASTIKVYDHAIYRTAEPSIFDNVVELSTLTLSTDQSYSFPGSFLAQVCRNSYISSTWFAVSPKEEFKKPDTERDAIACPAGKAFPVNAYSVQFWIYLLPSKQDQPRNILYKGSKSNVFAPHIYINAEDNHLIASVISSRSERHGGQTPFLVKSTKVIRQKCWTLVTITVDQCSLKLFINGKQDHKVRIKGKLMFNPAPIYLGKIPEGASTEELRAFGSFIGTMRDIRYYTRCLNQEEVSNYYSSAKVRKKTNKNTEIKVPECDPLTTKDLYNASVGDASWSSQSWTPEYDQQLMDLVEESTKEYYTEKLRTDFNTEYDPSKTQLVTANAHTLNPSKGIVEGFQLISHQRLKSMRTRFLMISMLNNKIDTVLPLVDFSQATITNSLAWRICRLRSVIFMELKNRAWKRILHKTRADRHQNAIRVIINRPRALKARESGADDSGKKSIFGQMYCQLHFLRPRRLRVSDRHWVVSFEGEGAQDAGGPFRESISAFCDDLQSDHLPLFIKCPNSHGYGNNQEKFIPNPSCSSSLYLSMFQFVGKMMGVAIRGSNYLNVDFASVVWKPLVGADITKKDLLEIDTLFVNQLNLIESLEDAGKLAETETLFTILTFDGQDVELKANGAEIPVTVETRMEYVDLALTYRLNEFKEQVAAMRKGLGTIIPVQLLPMFTWQQLERLVCGKREIDIALLKANTQYRQVQPKEPHIKFFWDALEEMSHTQRQQFLRFVWGQTRLPTEASWRQKFQIQPHRMNDDSTLPVSHTCFFSLELPKYTSFDVMKKKLLYAIANCEAIDTDFVADNIDWNTV